MGRERRCTPPLQNDRLYAPHPKAQAPINLPGMVPLHLAVSLASFGGVEAVKGDTEELMGVPGLPVRRSRTRAPRNRAPDAPALLATLGSWLERSAPGPRLRPGIDLEASDGW